MTVNSPVSETTSQSLECSLTSFAITRMSFEEVNSLRKKSDRTAGELPSSILKHVDEQTLACLVAARDGANSFKNRPDNFDQWGIVASSRYLGRQSFAQTLSKFAAEGPWNVSVQVVPNRSLHSPASTVGLALGCHGPCVGVGGGLDGETDAWLTALSLLQQHKLPGLWLIFCGWEPDEHVDSEGTPTNGARCTALALALQPTSAKDCLARLQLGCDSAVPSVLEIPAKRTALSQFEEFITAASQGDQLTINLGGCLATKIEWTSAEVSTIPLPVPVATPETKAA